ncbi:hypothetical protein C8Q72DRAFT_889648 [Fomitopsis betulina]|nr:hypothetical protein C8Q72DRAFT_889648 [Fomitopsis betulina]
MSRSTSTSLYADLQCGASAHMGVLRPSLADALASLENLQLLDLPLNQAITFANFEVLALLPRLRDLRIEIKDSEEDLCSDAPQAAEDEVPSPARTFRALQSLELELYHLHDATVLLSFFAFPSLNKLYAVGVAGSCSTSFSRIMQLAAMRCSHDLLENIEIGSGEEELGVGPVDDATGAITVAALNYLSVFTNLHCITVFSEISIVADDELIKKWASTWPCLEAGPLKIPIGGWEETQLTLHGLAYLVQHCPKLRWLGMDINTFDADTLTPPRDKYHNPCIRGFQVCQSPLRADPAKVGAFLFALFPNLEFLRDDYEDTITVEEWKPVIEVIEDLRLHHKAKKGAKALPFPELPPPQTGPGGLRNLPKSGIN